MIERFLNHLYASFSSLSLLMTLIIAWTMSFMFYMLKQFFVFMLLIWLLKIFGFITIHNGLIFLNRM